MTRTKHNIGVSTLDNRYLKLDGSNDPITGALGINVNSTTALLVEQTGVKSNVLVVDTTNGRVGINKVPTVPFDLAGAFSLSGQLTSTLAIGTSPFSVTSTTVNTNLNADLVDGMHVVGSGLTLTVPATGTAALLAVANVFTAIQAVNISSTTAFKVDQSGNNAFVVDTTNKRIGIGTTPSFRLHALNTLDGSDYYYIKNDSTGINAIAGFAAVGNVAGVVFRTFGSNYAGSAGAAYANSGQIRTDFGLTNGFFFSTGGTTAPIHFAVFDIEICLFSPVTNTVLMTPYSASVKGLVLRGKASQTANLQEWQNSSSTILTYIEPDGEIVIAQDSKALKLGTGLDATILYDGTNLVINPKVVGTGVLSVLGDISLLDEDIILGTTTGSQIGTAVGQKLAFHGSAPVVQRTGAAQAAVATTASTQTTPFGYTTAAQADGIITLLNEIRATLVEKGIMKGSA